MSTQSTTCPRYTPTFDCAMRMFKKTSYILFCFLSLFPLFKGAIVEANEIHLPKTIAYWARPDSAQLITSKNIFKYMNGAGELYLGYRFRRLEVFDYVSEQQDNILVELYFMETSDDAFGLLSLDWGGEPVIFDDSAAVKSPPPLTSSIRALYGAGLLRIWSGGLYARVMASRETPASKQAVLALGQAIAGKRENPPEPDVLKTIPLDIDSTWKLRKDRLSFFRSYLVLNSIYYVSHENILDLDHTIEGVIAPYENISGGKESKRSRLLLVKYSNNERALKALGHFHEAYLKEHRKEFTADTANEGPSLYKLEDGWLAYKLLDNYIAIVFESPDEEFGRLLIHKIEINLR